MTLFVELPKRKSRCAGGEEKFEPGMEYFSLLTGDEEKGFERLDFCARCWKEPDQSGTFWSGRVAVRKKKEQFSGEERDEHLLRLLRESDEPKERFLLALFLVRRKKLQLRKETTQHYYYEFLATEEMFTVAKVPLSEINVVEMQQKILGKLTT